MMEVIVNAISGPLMVFVPEIVVKDLLGVAGMAEDTAEVYITVK
jgi:hypothetical protein